MHGCQIPTKNLVYHLKKGCSKTKAVKGKLTYFLCCFMRCNWCGYVAAIVQVRLSTVAQLHNSVCSLIVFRRAHIVNCVTLIMEEAWQLWSTLIVGMPLHATDCVLYTIQVLHVLNKYNLLHIHAGLPVLASAKDLEGKVVALICILSDPKLKAAQVIDAVGPNAYKDLSDEGFTSYVSPSSVSV